MKNRSIKNTFELAPGQSLRDVPSLARGFYILVIDHGWVTPIGKAFRENLDIFKQRLGKHVLILLSTQEQTKEARAKFRSNKEHEPTLVVTVRHPATWDPKEDAEEGVKIALGSLDSPESLPLHLESLADALNLPEFVAAEKWDVRKRILKKYLKKVPVVDVLASVAGFFL